MLTYIEINPNIPAQYTVIWLHGLGADGQDFVPMVPELRLPEDLAVKFIFPNAPIQPITINNGYKMPAWYDIYEMNDRRIDSVIDSKGIEASITKIEELIQQEINRGIPASNIIIGGFSQGAVIALTLGLRRNTPLAGIIALSGYFPMADQTLKMATPATRQTPIFLAHGTADGIVPFALGQASHSLLKEAGCQVEWHAYPMEHSVCAEEIRDISKWMVKVLG